jgi:TRAP-type C4-dicarboxylate transport system permease small subunit
LNSALKLLRRGLDGLYWLGGVLAGVCLVVVLVLMMVMSIGRQIGFNVPSGDDFASWAMAAMAFLGLAYTFKSGDMIRVGLIIDRFEGRTKQVIEAIVLTMSLGFVGYFAWHAVSFVMLSIKFHDMSTGVVSIPLWIPQLGFAGGIVLLAIALLDELIHVLLGGMPRYEKPKPKTAEEVIEQALTSAV